MADNTNDNQDFDLEEEEEESTEGEGEGEGSSTEGDEDAEEEDEEEGEGEGEEGKKKKDGEEEDEDEFVMPEKFKDKDEKTIAKSYVELEKRIQTEAQRIAKEITGKNRKPSKKQEEDLLAELKGVDFAKMKPEEFAQFILKAARKQAEEMSRSTYESAEKTREQVQGEIAVVSKSWPQLKENEGFRDLVLTYIENAANKGEILTLKEACAKAGKALGQKPGAKKEEKGEEGKEEDDKKKVRKLGVERQSGSGGGEKETDEEKILAGILGAGATPGNKLGGLGI